MTYWPFQEAPFDVPYSAQVEALERSAGKRGFAYFMEMGLGKSKTGIADFGRYHVQDRLDCMIIICPKFLKLNWVDEWKSSTLYEGSDDQIQVWPAMPKRLDKIKFAVFNYEALLTDKGAKAFEELLSTKRCYVGLDESSKIKNPQAKTTKYLLKRANLMAMRRIMTGTDITQSVMDAWPQIKFVYPDYPLTLVQYRYRYAILGGFQGKQVVGSRNIDELKDTLEKVGFRALKKDYLDLPEKLPPITRYFDLLPAQQKAYSDMKRHFIVELQKYGSTDITPVIAKQTITQWAKLAQISRGFVHYDGEEERETADFIGAATNPIYSLIDDIIEETQGNVIITTRHRYFTNKLIAYLSEKYLTTYIIGGMKDAELAEQKRLFNQATERTMMVLQIDTGSLGHTLLAPAELRCKTMIFAENSFSLEKRMQVEDRIHRIGQDQACTYIDLVGTSFDKKVIRALQKKMELVDMIRSPAGLMDFLKD